MDRKLADTLEKNADLAKTPFIQNEITERILEKTGGEGLYNKFIIDLSEAHTDKEYFFSGDRITVEDVDDAVTIKLNSRKNDPIDLQLIPQINGPIKKFYITNAAGSGELKLLCGSKGMFEAKKKLNLAGTTASYIIYKAGSLVKAMDGSDGRIISSNQYLDVPFNAAAALLLNGGTIYIKRPPTGIYNITAQMTIPFVSNGGINVIGEGYNWKDYGCVIKAVADTGTAMLKCLDTGVHMNVFRNLSFHGNETAGTYGLTGLDALGQDMRIENCSFYDLSNGIKLYAQTNVTGCWLERCAQSGIYVTSYDNIIANNIFWDNLHDMRFYTPADKCRILHNRTRDSTEFIYSRPGAGASVDDMQIIGNIAYDLDDYFIYIYDGDIDNWIIKNNIIDGETNTTNFMKIAAGSSITNSICKNNSVRNLTGNVFDGTITGLDITENIGYITENNGVATILSGNASIAIAHGLDGTPTVFNIAGQHSEVSDIYVTTIGAANFTIAAKDGNTSADRDIYWEAKVR